jgi:hypothetical protein
VSDLSALQTWVSQNQGNATVAASANDLFYSGLAANMNTDAAVDYAKRMTPEALAYQRASQSIADESAIRQMGVTGDLTRDLLQQQGDLSYREQQLESGDSRYASDAQVNIAQEQGLTDRYTADRGLDAALDTNDANRYRSDSELAGTREMGATQRYGADRGVDVAREQGATERYGADRGLDAAREQGATQRYGADRELEGAKYGADRGLEGLKYGADRNLEGVKDTNLTSTRNLQVGGDEERKTLGKQTDEALRLRADARGAIAVGSKRFYG